MNSVDNADPNSNLLTTPNFTFTICENRNMPDISAFMPTNAEFLLPIF